MLRGWRETDLEDLIQMNADPEVMRFFPEPYSEARSRDQYRLIQNEFEQAGYGLYAAEEKCGGEFMGYIGFHQASLQVDFCPCIEIAWRLAQRFWNQGYATRGLQLVWPMALSTSILRWSIVLPPHLIHLHSGSCRRSG